MDKKNNRITPKLITTLRSKEIFVFGSNESGRHGAGAALTAQYWGAKYGQAFGLQGKTFGIPTVNSSITKPLPVKRIKLWVDNFISIAKTLPEYTFLVTEIGCGLAKLTPKEIAPLFKECRELENVFLPEKFWRILEEIDERN